MSHALTSRLMFDRRVDTVPNARTALVWVITVSATLVTVCGCRRSEAPSTRAREVVVYTSVDDVFARPIAEKFENETGILVRLVPDTEETKSTGLLNRLIAEKDRPQADVFWSGDPIRAAILKAKGVSMPYRPPQAEGLPARFSDPQHYWTGFSARARILIYNTDKVLRGEEPRSIMDLLDPRFRGQACIANPLFGTMSMHAAALFVVLGEKKARDFFKDFAANGGKMLSSNGEVRRRVANGEFAVGITDTDDANVARLEGKPIGIAYPDQEGLGTLVVPNCAVLIARGPHPEEGQRFIDFLLTPDIEEALARSAAAQMPLRPGVTVPAGTLRLDDFKSMEVNYSELARLLQPLTEGFLKDWSDQNSG